jgi:uncharacterized protein YaeQ
MALPSTIYRVIIQLSDIDHGVYETIQTTVAQHPSETEERLVARLLALAIFYEPELICTKGISATDEPDLWIIGPDGRTKFWIEVGLPESDRIIKACRHAEKVALLACGKTLSNWDQQHLPKLEKVKNLTTISVGQTFISTLASQLERSINWSITITEGVLYLTNGDETYETAIQIKTGTL